jgi:hypothetical protein
VKGSILYILDYTVVKEVELFLLSLSLVSPHFQAVRVAGRSYQHVKYFLPVAVKFTEKQN